MDLATYRIIDVGAGNTEYDDVAIPIHGVAMCLVFIVGFPLGAFLIRLASFRGLIWIHANAQLLSYLVAIIELGLRVYIAYKGALMYVSISPNFPQRSAG